MSGAARSTRSPRSCHSAKFPFHALSSEALAEWQADLAPRAYDDYLWLLRRHLLPFFHGYRVSEITRQLVWTWRAQKIKEREDLDAMHAQGVIVRDQRGNPRRGLGPRKLNQAVRLLAAVLDEAVDRDLIDTNPARDKKLRRKVPKPLRTFLELDELAALLDAVRELEREGRADLRVGAMRAMRAEGKKLGGSPSTSECRLPPRATGAGMVCARRGRAG